MMILHISSLISIVTISIRPTIHITRTLYLILLLQRHAQQFLIVYDVILVFTIIIDRTAFFVIYFGHDVMFYVHQHLTVDVYRFHLLPYLLSLAYFVLVLLLSPIITALSCFYHPIQSCLYQ